MEIIEVVGEGKSVCKTILNRLVTILGAQFFINILNI